MMALSVLSLVRHGGGQHIDASYYYNQVASSHGSLCGNEDFLSDAVYLTHFLLLIYEVGLPSELLSAHVCTMPANSEFYRLWQPTLVVQTFGQTMSPGCST